MGSPAVISMDIESTWQRAWNRIKRLYEIEVDDYEAKDQTPSANYPGILKLRENFEGREAIYIEKGAIRVRVTNIRVRATDEKGTPRPAWVSAKVEEITTPGLAVGMRDARLRKPNGPLSWRIGGCRLSSFSDSKWVGGYGGWSLYFDPKIVQGVLDLASRFPDNMDSTARYNQIVMFTQAPRLGSQGYWQPVFGPITVDDIKAMASAGVITSVIKHEIEFSKATFKPQDIAAAQQAKVDPVLIDCMKRQPL